MKERNEKRDKRRDEKRDEKIVLRIYAQGQSISNIALFMDLEEKKVEQILRKNKKIK